MTTVILRLCVKGFFEHHSYYQNNCFLEGEWGGKWKCLGWLYFFCSKKSSVRPVCSKSAEVILTFILLQMWGMSYIFYINHRSEFEIWIKMWRGEVFLWMSVIFLLTMLSKQMFPFSLSRFEKLIIILLVVDLQDESTSEQTQTFL